MNKHSIIALRLAKHVDFLDFSMENSTPLVIKTREIIANKTGYPPHDVFNAAVLVQWQNDHRTLYAELLTQQYKEEDLLDMLLKIERNKTVKSMQTSINNIFADWKWI
jgi:hypothetical protein